MITCTPTSDDSIYRYIVFDIDISYRIVSSKKISNFSIYRDIFYISRYFRYIAIFNAKSWYFLLLLPK